MSDRQTTDLNSARFVLAVLLSNEALVNADAKLKLLLDFLTLTIPIVDDAAGVQLAGRGGTQNFKDNLKIDGSAIGKKWLTALKTVEAAADMNLPGIVEKSLSVYENLPDNKWYQFNLKLIPKCREYLDEVSQYGRSAAEITALENKNILFEKAMTKPEEVTHILSQAKEAVEKGMDGINELARNTDKYVRAYEDLHPAFVAAFFDSREKKGK